MLRKQGFSQQFLKIQPYIQGYEVRESKPLSVTEKLILFTPLDEYVVGTLITLAW